jgi:hypothetical protein
MSLDDSCNLVRKQSLLVGPNNTNFFHDYDGLFAMQRGTDGKPAPNILNEHLISLRHGNQIRAELFDRMKFGPPLAIDQDIQLLKRYDDRNYSDNERFMLGEQWVKKYVSGEPETRDDESDHTYPYRRSVKCCASNRQICRKH